MQCGTVTNACRAGGITTSTFYEWKKHPEFAEALSEADLRVRDKLEAEAQRRAIEGKSDRLLVFLLKGHNPQRYAPRPDPGAADVNNTLILGELPPEAIGRLSDDEISVMRRLARRSGCWSTLAITCAR